MNTELINLIHRLKSYLSIDSSYLDDYVDRLSSRTNFSRVLANRLNGYIDCLIDHKLVDFHHPDVQQIIESVREIASD